MNLVRLALLTLSKSSSDEWGWCAEIDGVVLNTQRLGEHIGPARLLISAELSLGSLPTQTSSGHIVIEGNLLRRCERAIEEFANLAAVVTQSRRALHSPIPEVAFNAVTEEERSWLDESAGIHRPGRYSGALHWNIEITERNVELLRDRSDGIALLAEALSEVYPTGRFRGMMRVFERGFKLSGTSLVNPVAAFLSHFGAFRFDQAEVGNWKRLRACLTWPVFCSR
jgi:hypothetical protein